MAAVNAEHNPATPGFDPLQNLQPGEELIASRFLGARSSADMAAVRAEYAREEETLRRLGDGPLSPLFASAFAVLLDPLNYIPILGQEKAALSVSRAALRAGASLAAITALQEGALQSVQHERSVLGSAAAILLGGAFGAGIGGVTATLASKAYKAAVKEFVEVAAENTPLAEPVAKGGQGGLSADTVRALRPEDTVLAPTFGVAEKFAGLSRFGMAAPVVELASSPLPESRLIGQQLASTGVPTAGNFKMVASDVPVQTRIASWDAVKEAAKNINYAGYAEYKAAGGELTRTEFLEEVGTALSRGDTHTNPVIQKTAVAQRTVLNDIQKEGVRVGIAELAEKITNALSYFPVVYDRLKIKAKYPEFLDRVTNALVREIGEPNGKVLADGKVLDYGQIAREIGDKILGHSGDRIPTIRYKEPSLRGPAKERTLDIPVEDMRDFHVTNVETVMERHISTLAADIEMMRMFGRTDPAAELGARVRDNAKNLAADPAMSEADRAALFARAEKEAGLVEQLAEHIRGTQGGPADPRYAGLKRAGKVARNTNFFLNLGGVALASIPDLARTVSKEGFTRVFGAITRDAVDGFKAIRVSMAQAQKLGTALDMQRSTRVGSILDMGSAFPTDTVGERISGRLAQEVSKWSGINILNTVNKSVVSMLATDRILRSVKKFAEGGELTRREMGMLGEAGIGREQANAIAAQAEHWDHGHVTLANLDAWTDPAAKDAFRFALLHDVDNTIITPHVGDAPLWTSSDIGKTLFQFKRFSMAATHRVLLSDLAYRDKQAMSGLAAMFGLGLMTVAIKDVSSTGEIKERTPRQWAVDAFDRSGMAAIFMEGDALMSKTVGFSPATMIAGREPSRFAQRNLVEQALGPTAGLIQNAAAAATVAGHTREFTLADLHKIRKLVPGQNLFYLQYLFNKLEEGAGNGLGLPDAP